MKKRFSIWVRQFGSNRDIEFIQCDSNPQDIVNGLHKKFVTIKKSIFEPGKRKTRIAMYTNIYVVENDQHSG